MANEKEKLFFVTTLFGSLLQKAGQHAPEERILKIDTAPSSDNQKPEGRSLPVPAVTSPPVNLPRGISRYLEELGRESNRQTRARSVIGREAATGQLRSVSDTDRRSGLYILGISGMRKSWLPINPILQDIKRGHGLVFLDPHGSAIDDVLERSCLGTDSRYKECLVFNPEDRNRSFGLNILRCEKTESLNTRQNTYTRAKGVFDKIWKSAYYEVPWLQEVRQYTLYAFIENQDYTLGDAPLFLTDRDFREHIVTNIRYNRQAADFWRCKFDPKRAGAALTRLDTLLGDPYVHDIVAQLGTTIDFPKFMEEKRIVLIRLSDRLSKDVKSFIGTILISELVGAVKRRSTANPHQFFVYVD